MLKLMAQGEADVSKNQLTSQSEVFSSMRAILDGSTRQSPGFAGCCAQPVGVLTTNPERLYFDGSEPE